MSASSRNDTGSFFRPWLSILIFVTLGFSSHEGWASDVEKVPIPTYSSANAPLSPQSPTISLFNSIPLGTLLELLQTIHPTEIIFNNRLDKSSLTSALFDLVQYMANNVDTQTPDEILAQVPKYKRVEMFGTWVNENAPQDCYNTRAEVLIRDAVPGTSLSPAPANPCQIARGDWRDPYSGTTYKLASAIQIDHVVPLKNAYRSGAHAWTRDRRCSYANFLADPHHLLAVSGHENMVKSDSGPEDYIPPDNSYVCAYVTNWIRIKATWNMHFSHDEFDAIQKLIVNHSCNIADTRVDLVAFQNSRTRTTVLNSKCVDPGVPLTQ